MIREPGWMKKKSYPGEQQIEVPIPAHTPLKTPHRAQCWGKGKGITMSPPRKTTLWVQRWSRTHFARVKSPGQCE